jgi:hypothetical protein
MADAMIGATCTSYSCSVLQSEPNSVEQGKLICAASACTLPLPARPAPLRLAALAVRASADNGLGGWRLVMVCRSVSTSHAELVSPCALSRLSRGRTRKHTMIFS